MGKRIEMEGRIFGRLVVVDLHGINRNNERTYTCLCECGGYLVTQGSTLRKGRAKSCGCLRREGGMNFRAQLAARADRFAERSAKPWGRLTLLSQRFDGDVELWTCRCECGVTREFRAGDVLSGSSRSCGCLRRETARATAMQMHLQGRLASHPWRAEIMAQKGAAQ